MLLDRLYGNPHWHCLLHLACRKSSRFRIGSFANIDGDDDSGDQYEDHEHTERYADICQWSEEEFLVSEACSLMSESQVRGIRTGSRSPTGLVTGDFNNDSFVDLVVTNPIDNTLSIFLGHRNGTFSSARVYLMPNGSRPWEIATADFNNDTILDLGLYLYGIYFHP